MEYREEEVIEAVIQLGELALKFGRIDRTCVAHKDGLPESDSDHTVMLAWIAPALADLINKKVGYTRYDVGTVTQYAVVHDACEVYAGDTPTIQITEEELRAKALREGDATALLYDQFIKRLPWFARMVNGYEVQAHPAARFVRSVDKIMPKIVHVINKAQDLARAGMTESTFREVVARQRKQVETWCPEPLLLTIYDALCDRVLAMDPALPQPTHYLHVGYYGTSMEHVVCDHELHECPFAKAHAKFSVGTRSVPLRFGRYPVALTEDSLLNFIGKQD